MSTTPNILRTPVTEPSAWSADDLAADTSWQCTLSTVELEELDHALSNIQPEKRAALDFSKRDFVLPVLEQRLRSIVHELEFGRGVVLLRGLEPGRYNGHDLRALYWGLGTHLGTAIAQNARGDLIGQVTDSGRDYFANNVRGYTTRAALRPHCDASDVVGLLCVHPAQSGGASCIASATTIYNMALTERPEFVPLLCAGFHFDLRGEGISDDPNEVTKTPVPVFSYYGGRLSCRFNGKTIIDGMVKAGKPLDDESIAAIEWVQSQAMKPGIRFDMDFRPGDIQLLSNHMVLHSRTEYVDWPEPERKRRLLRQWFNLRNGRPLATDFADRLNTGPRGGVFVRS